jgi:hypothetical protein
MFAPSKVTAERRAICDKCKYFKKKTKTCGTPIVGDKVTYRKKEYKLCGCFMDIKARLLYSRCPLGKWQDEYKISEIEYKELKELLSHAVNEVSREENTKLHYLHNKYLKSGVKGSRCIPCVLKIINDLHKVVEQYEQE